MIPVRGSQLMIPVWGSQLMIPIRGSQLMISVWGSQRMFYSAHRQRLAVSVKLSYKRLCGCVVEPVTSVKRNFQIIVIWNKTGNDA